MGKRVLMHAQRILVPKTLQSETLRKLRKSQSKDICMAAQSLKAIHQLHRAMPKCDRDTTPNKEPLIPTGVSIHWTGILDWTTGLDYWTDLFASKNLFFFVL